MNLYKSLLEMKIAYYKSMLQEMEKELHELEIHGEREIEK